MSDQVDTIEKEVLKAFDKIHNPENKATESEAQKILSNLKSPSAIRDTDKKTLLHHACNNGWYNVAVSLTEQLCDPNCVDIDGAIPLHLACKGGNLDLVKYLVIMKKCDPNKEDKTGKKPLHYAALAGHLSIAKYFIDEKECNATTTDNEGKTPLHLACEFGKLSMAKYLIKDKGCKPSTATNDGYTSSLHLACRNGHYEVVKYLVENQRCDPKSYDADGFPAVHLACQSGNLKLVKYLIDEKGCNPSHYINVQEQGKQAYAHFWWYPLHSACKNGHLNVAKYLIEEKNCTASCKSSENLTPLHLACRYGHLSTVKYLIHHQKCDPSAQRTNGCTPLHAACQNGHIEVAMYLIEEAHVDPTSKSKEYWTPFHLACDNGYLNIVKYLAEKWHCDCEQKTFRGDTPLSLAFKKHHLHIITYLINERRCRADHSQITLTEKLIKDHTEIAMFLIATRSIAENSLSIEAKQSHLFQPAFKVYAFGHEHTGKSSFIKAIQSYLQSGSYWVTNKLKKKLEHKVTDVIPHTTGIVPIHFQSYNQEHSYVIYDFAAGDQYQSSHAAFLENVSILSSQGYLTMIFINISKHLDQCISQLQFWTSFVDNQFRNRTSPLIIICSHADIAKAQGEDPDQKVKQVLKDTSGHKAINYITVLADCRLVVSDGIEMVCNKMSQLHDLYNKGLEVNVQVHYLKHLMEKNSLHETVACQFTDVKNLVRSEESSTLQQSGLISTDNEELSQQLTVLSEGGYLLFLKNNQDVSKSWVIFNTGILFESMNTVIFAHDKATRPLNAAGIISLTDIKTMFPEYDPNTIIGLATHLMFCCEINESDAQLITQQRMSNSFNSNTYYFFPALMISDHANFILAIQHKYHKWQCQLVNDYDSITSRFTHVMLIKMITDFLASNDASTDVDLSLLAQPMCSVWKTGIQWQTSMGMQIRIEVRDTCVSAVTGCQNKLNWEVCKVYCTNIVKELREIAKQMLGAVELKEQFSDCQEEESFAPKSNENGTIDSKG